jgi:hypothetical protein
MSKEKEVEENGVAERAEQIAKAAVPKLIKWGIAFVVVSLLALTFYLAAMNHVGINEVGVAYNSVGGRVWIQDHPGWYLTAPTVEVAVLTTLPLTVTIPSEAKVINTKIVRFKPEGVDEFIRLQGFSYYSDQSLQNILMGYAFSGKQYPFLEIMQESGAETVTSPPLRK